MDERSKGRIWQSGLYFKWCEQYEGIEFGGEANNRNAGLAHGEKRMGNERKCMRVRVGGGGCDYIV